MGNNVAFNLSQYGNLLEAVVEGGYNSKCFCDETIEDKSIFMRHDVDKNLDWAIRIAQCDLEYGIKSNFFFLTRCPLYNLMEPEARRKIIEISGMGHWIGLHCDVRRVLNAYNGSEEDLEFFVERELDIFERILDIPVQRMVSFHNPPQSILYYAPKANFASTYEPRFLSPRAKYISDSNAFWKEGNPVNHIRAGRWSRLQILTHPIWWFRKSSSRPEELLAEALRLRYEEMDAYLKNSNDLWKKYAYGKVK